MSLFFGTARQAANSTSTKSRNAASKTDPQMENMRWVIAAMAIGMIVSCFIF